LNLRPHEAQLEDQKPTKSSRRSFRRRKSRKTKKGIKTANQVKMAKKSQEKLKTQIIAQKQKKNS
jgi:hypothetical protein